MDTLIKLAALLTILLGLATLDCGTCCFTSCSSSSKSTVKEKAVPTINSYTYEKGRQEMVIEFTNGKSYLLEKVPEAVFHGLSKSDSKDRFYEESIQGKFRSQRQ